jgi:hypothetical protein
LSIVYDTDSSRDSRLTCSTTVGCDVSILSLRPLTAIASWSRIPRFASCRNHASPAQPANSPSSSATRIAGNSRARRRTGCEDTVAIPTEMIIHQNKDGGQNSPPHKNLSLEPAPVLGFSDRNHRNSGLPAAL